MSLRTLWDWAQDASPARHEVALVLADAPCVGDEEKVGFGAFVVFDDGRLAIYVVGENPLPEEIEPDEWAGWIRENFFHEYAHYEQYRDGRPLVEEGVPERAAELARLYEQEELGQGVAFVGHLMNYLRGEPSHPLLRPTARLLLGRAIRRCTRPIRPHLERTCPSPTCPPRPTP